MIYDVIIIGLGPAGISASIYAARAGLNVAAINFLTPGGIVNESFIVENYPGFISIKGPELAYKFFEHFNSYDIPLFNEEVIDIKKEENIKVITNKNVYESKRLIICSGRKPKKLNILEEEKYIGKGISYCSICDGNLYKNKDIVVIGGGNSALENALYLSNIASNVTILVRSNQFRGTQSLIEEVENKKNINILFETNIKELITENDIIKGIKTNKDDISCDGIFVHIGFEPSINILKSLDIKMDNNYIIVDKNMETNIKGIYACGDIIKKDLYQIVTAVSEGAQAAMASYKSLKNE